MNKTYEQFVDMLQVADERAKLAVETDRVMYCAVCSIEAGRRIETPRIQTQKGSHNLFKCIYCNVSAVYRVK